MKTPFWLAAVTALVLVVGHVGCDGNGDGNGNGNGNGNADAGGGGGGGGGGADAGVDGGTMGGVEFTTFVRELIENETKEDNAPVSVDQNFVDTEPADAFPASFFQ